MSRCFPFPPPGFEKKARTDDVDLLKKEKHRDKKHKKEKRDKEKREGKEKKEKDRNDGKQREKKDRKEKHRDRKKDREKDGEKNKEKSSTSDEKRLAGQPEGHNGEMHNQNEKDRAKDKDSILEGKRISGQFLGYNGEKLSQNSHPAEERKDSRLVQELGRRIRDEDRGTGNQFVEKLNRTDQKKDEGMVRLVAKDIDTWAEGREKDKDKDNRGDDRKMEGQGIKDEAKFGGNSMVQNLARMGKVEGMSRRVEKNTEKKVEGEEKTKEKEGDDKRGDKRKDKDREKKSQGKEKDKDKDKKKEEKVKEKTELKSMEQHKFKGSNKNDPIGIQSVKTSHLSKDGSKSAATEGSLRKRKDLETNGFLYVNDVRPGKLPRLTSSHPLTENGRILEPCQTPITITSGRQGSASNLKANNEHGLNGLIEALPISDSSRKHSIPSAQADQIVEASIKPPHPDTKYLSHIHSVPRIEEWSDFDDQEWLFGSDKTQSKRPKAGSSLVDERPQVWAEALQIESADVCALPYVIPY